MVARQIMLLMDREIDESRRIQDLLSDHGYQVECHHEPWIIMNGLDAGVVACLILAANLNELNGLEILERYQLAGMPLPPVIMIGPNEVALSHRAHQAGVSNYLSEPASAALLLNAVALCFGPAKKRRKPKNDEEKLIAGLSGRQRQILLEIVKGNSSAEIATRLKITKSTVSYHRHNLLQKMAAKSTGELVQLAMRGGLGQI